MKRDAGRQKVYIERQSARQGDRLEFTYEGKRYTLELTRLVNMLVGDDHAEFTLARSDGEAAEEPHE